MKTGVNLVTLNATFDFIFPQPEIVLNHNTTVLHILIEFLWTEMETHNGLKISQIE